MEKMEAIKFKTAIISKIWEFCKNNISDIDGSNKLLTNNFHKVLISLDFKIDSGKICLLDSFSTSINSINSEDSDDIHKIGVLAFTANPIHWGHIISSLMLIDELDLNLMVFLIQGEMTYKKIDESQKLPKELRHAMVKNVVEAFNPLIKYSDVGFDNDKIGEFNVLNLFALNPKLKIQLFYFSGTESIKRVNDIIDNLQKASQEICKPNSLQLALVTLKNVDARSHIQKKNGLDVIEVLSSYSLEMHSSQFRDGNKFIAPILVKNMINNWK